MKPNHVKRPTGSGLQLLLKKARVCREDGLGGDTLCKKGSQLRQSSGPCENLSFASVGERSCERCCSRY